MNARRQAEIEETFDTVPEAQFRSTRLIAAALAEVQRDRARLEAENAELRAALLDIRATVYGEPMSSQVVLHIFNATNRVLGVMVERVSVS